MLYLRNAGSIPFQSTHSHLLLGDLCVIWAHIERLFMSLFSGLTMQKIVRMINVNAIVLAILSITVSWRSCHWPQTNWTLTFSWILRLNTSKCVFVQVRALSYHRSIVLLDTSLFEIQLNACWLLFLHVVRICHLFNAFIVFTDGTLIFQFLENLDVWISIFNIENALGQVDCGTFAAFHLLRCDIAIG